MQKTMTLSQKQRLFSRLYAELVLFAYEYGYEVSHGDTYRDPRAFGEVGEKAPYGSSKSLHKVRLAGDINLFKNGRYLRSKESHRFLGEKWKTMHPLCRWGGDYGSDANHYSLSHWGLW